MIPGDLTAELARLLASLARAGTLPPAAATLSASGTWRPAGSGSYATTLAFELAGLAARAPEAIAAELAEALAAVPWIREAQAAGGYLTATVTHARLADLPARIIASGPASVCGEALAGRNLTAPYPPDLAVAPDWTQAWRAQRAALIGRLEQAAGADVLFFHSESKAAATSRTTAGVARPRACVAYFGLDAVRFALAAAARPGAASIERQLGKPLDLTNSFVRVRYARADAASTLRWAADLRLPAGTAASAVAASLHPAELRLIDAMSWLPERIAAASRRHRPADLVAFLDKIAEAWLDCSQQRSALPFRGRGAGDGRPDVAARLELAEAASTVLAAGLGLLGVAAPAMM